MLAARGPAAIEGHMHEEDSAAQARLGGAQRRLLAALADAEVRFVLIGGTAARLRGATRATDDVDIAPGGGGANLARLSAALEAVDARWVTGQGPVDGAAIDAELLTSRQVVSLATRHGALDVVWDPPGSSGYARLAAQAGPVDVDGREVDVADREALIAMKSATGRDKDRAVVAELERATRG